MTGEHGQGNTPAESIGHIQSAGCLAQRESVTAAHNKCIKGLMSDIQEAGKKKSSLKLLTPESEHTISTLWEQDGCDKICSKEELWQASQAFEMSNAISSSLKEREIGDTRMKHEQWTWLANNTRALWGAFGRSGSRKDGR